MNDGRPVAVRYPLDVVRGDSLGYLNNCLFPFASDHDVHSGTGVENVFQAIGGLLASYDGEHFSGQGVYQLAHFIELIFPVDADAQEVYFFGDKLLQLLLIPQGACKPEIKQRQLLYMRSQSCGNVLQAGGWKDCETQRPGMAVPEIWMQAKGVFVNSCQGFLIACGPWWVKWGKLAAADFSHGETVLTSRTEVAGDSGAHDLWM